MTGTGQRIQVNVAMTEAEKYRLRLAARADAETMSAYLRNSAAARMSGSYALDREARQQLGRLESQVRVAGRNMNRMLMLLEVFRGHLEAGADLGGVVLPPDDLTDRLTTIAASFEVALHQLAGVTSGMAARPAEADG